MDPARQGMPPFRMTRSASFGDVHETEEFDSEMEQQACSAQEDADRVQDEEYRRYAQSVVQAESLDRGKYLQRIQESMRDREEGFPDESRRPEASTEEQDHWLSQGSRSPRSGGRPVDAEEVASMHLQNMHGMRGDGGMERQGAVAAAMHGVGGTAKSAADDDDDDYAQWGYMASSGAGGGGDKGELYGVKGPPAEAVVERGVRSPNHSFQSLGSDESDGEPLYVEREDAFQRILITGTSHLNEEQQKSCLLLQRARELRRKHLCPIPNPDWGCFRPTDAGSPVDGPSEPAASPARPQTGRFSLLRQDSEVPRSVEDNPPPEAGVANVGLHEEAERARTRAKIPPRVRRFFHKLRPAPEFKPFEAPVFGPMEAGSGSGFAARWRDGVMLVYRTDALLAASRQENADDTQQRRRVQESRGNVRYNAHRRKTTPPKSASACDSTPDVGGYVSRTVTPLYDVETLSEFLTDYNTVVSIVHRAPVKQFAYRRLQLLEARFELHRLLNGTMEVEEQRSVPHRDFYNLRKVDTHVHHSACMNQKHLLRFIKHKLKVAADEVVAQQDGEPLTLAQVFERLHLTAYDLSVDTLDMHADHSTFHRFDRFNLKYNPIGQSLLREIFLKTDNHIRGRYLAEVTREVFDDLENSKYQLAEYRLSVYGRKVGEWDKLASWVVDNKLASPNVRWMIQVPRLYHVYKSNGQVNNFGDMLKHLFEPLFAVTLDPSSNPKLHQFLSMVVGFDCVDDESKQESSRDAEVPLPEGWSSEHNPPYYYYMYFLAANLKSLNQLRQQRGLNSFQFRPHGGEAGDVDHLAACFLVAHGVNHGITMKRAPAIQYLYYLDQVPLAMSPLSNNRLFLEYPKNPFYNYFARGLNVSLSTDDPLLLHFTKEPLVEEYCVATQVWRFTPADMAEIALHSVKQSGFEHPWKRHFLGSRYSTPGPQGNEIYYTNVPNIRLQYRAETLEGDCAVIQHGAALSLGLVSPEQPLPLPKPALWQEMAMPSLSLQDKKSRGERESQGSPGTIQSVKHHMSDEQAAELASAGPRVHRRRSREMGSPTWNRSPGAGPASTGRGHASVRKRRSSRPKSTVLSSVRPASPVRMAGEEARGTTAQQRRKPHRQPRRGLRVPGSKEVSHLVRRSGSPEPPGPSISRQQSEGE